MALMRRALLWASGNPWLRERFPRYRFVRRTAHRFLPGEDLASALAAARSLQSHRIEPIFTHLGENVATAAEAESVAAHYADAMRRIHCASLFPEVSVKLTHLGLDLAAELCQEGIESILAAAGSHGFLWIDMESSAYVDRTLDLYRAIRRRHPNVGVCLQAYLRRTSADIESLIPAGAAIRLVKGAYLEPATVAFSSKREVDENFLRLARTLLSKDARETGVRAGIATHDREIIRQIEAFAQAEGLTRDDFEFQMLYGVRRDEQIRLARAGWRVRVLISYGAYWFPWLMRRMAERPANLWFLARNLI